ncbi:hypothetical protein CDD83_1096 [Cordyceps sp. RAO-2017]|nr:hypothetical protein CDD83_1096 [Cordyceps sp. RAO-2017]
MFGPASVDWMARWLTGDQQKCTDLQMEDRRGLGPDNRSRNFTYVKPLNASLGPKQTKCIVAETLENMDLERAVNLSVSTQNPDVPSGNVFCVKTKYCLSWAENSCTRVQVNCTTEWTGKSWLKGPIEKGVGDGQMQYCRDLFAALKSAVSSRSRPGVPSGGAPRIKKKLKRSKALQSADGSVEGGGGLARADTKNWGPLEPVRGLAEPLLDVVRPVLTSNVMYGLLVGLLVAMWFGFGSSPTKNSASYGPEVGYYSPSRLAAYEEMWRREESELWDWLEERVGLDRLSSDASNGVGGVGGVGGKRTMAGRSVEDKLRDGQMDERDVEAAIWVTEEKLKVLKDAFGRNGRVTDRERESGRRGER